MVMGLPTANNEAIPGTKEMDWSNKDITAQVENHILDSVSEMSRFSVPSGGFPVPQFEGAADLLKEMKKQSKLIASIDSEVRSYLWRINNNVG